MACKLKVSIRWGKLLFSAMTFWSAVIFANPLPVLPYKYVNNNWDSSTKKIQVESETGLRPLYDVFSPTHSKLEGVVLAFATGECGVESWGGIAAADIVAGNVAELERAKIDFYISTGGQADIFTCGSDEGMRSMLSRYQSTHFKGIDFDIEGSQTEEQIRQLVARAAFIRKNYPHLRVSFTLSTHAGSDNRAANLNQTGRSVLKAIREQALEGAVINLMVMDYGPANPSVCVVKRGICDMGKSALQAAKNFAREFKWPFSQIAVTAMIGVNDVVENVFTLADADLLRRQGSTLGLNALHYWAIDRDRECEGGRAAVLPSCHGLKNVPSGAFLKSFRGIDKK